MWNLLNSLGSFLFMLSLSPFLTFNSLVRSWTHSSWRRVFICIYLDCSPMIPTSKDQKSITDAVNIGTSEFPNQFLPAMYCSPWDYRRDPALHSHLMEQCPPLDHPSQNTTSSDHNAHLWSIPPVQRSLS
jgi:hypothetical protein